MTSSHEFHDDSKESHGHGGEIRDVDVPFQDLGHKRYNSM